MRKYVDLIIIATFYLLRNLLMLFFNPQYLSYIIVCCFITYLKMFNKYKC